MGCKILKTQPQKNEVISEDFEPVKKRFLDRIEKCGVGYKALNSGPRELQKPRFELHHSIISCNDSLLDIGCGIGEFRYYLLDKGHKGNYYGIDIVEPFVQHCQNHLPGHFEIRNFAINPPNIIIDCLVASQVFNYNYENSSNLRVITDLLDWSQNHVRKALSIDFLTCRCDFSVDHLFHYSPDYMLDLAEKYGQATLIEDYAAPWEFCIQIRKIK